MWPYCKGHSIPREGVLAAGVFSALPGCSIESISLEGNVAYRPWMHLFDWIGPYAGLCEERETPFAWRNLIPLLSKGLSVVNQSFCLGVTRQYPPS
jgi:hypothetical protein